MLIKQQEEIKKHIIEDIYKNNMFNYYKIIGDAGTGKTLLIYDIAKSISNNKKTCIIHSRILNNGHKLLDKSFYNCNIISAKDLKNTDLSKYEIIIIDESQRLYKKQFYYLIDISKDYNIKLIFSVGIDQLMQISEINNDINGKINSLELCKEYVLSNKIRTNKNISSFIKNVFDLKETNLNANYDNIEIYYTSEFNETIELIKYFNLQNYKYISFTPSMYNKYDLIDSFISSDNTHTVIGQDYNNIVKVLCKNFNYLDNKLYSLKHPVKNYIFEKLFYQGVTRVKENLAIIVFENSELYKQLIKIKLNDFYIKK